MVKFIAVDRVRSGERHPKHKRGTSVLSAMLSLVLGVVDSDTWSGPENHSHSCPYMVAKIGYAVGVDAGSSDCDYNASRRSPWTSGCTFSRPRWSQIRCLLDVELRNCDVYFFKKAILAILI